jgi:hypothetical protein
MEVGVASEIDSLKSESIQTRAKQLNPYSEQPAHLATEAAEYESFQTFPSYTLFPDLAKTIAEADLQKLSEACEQLTSFKPNNKAEIIEEIAENLKYANPILFTNNFQHNVKFQKTWIDETSFIPAEYPWITQENLLYIDRINRRLKELAKESLQYEDKWNIGKHVLDEIQNLSAEPRDDVSASILNVNSKIEGLEFGDKLVYHGLSRDALIDVLASGGLKCRAKQIDAVGEARFNTVKSKISDQEMYNTSFSNQPDRGYTGNMDANVNPYLSWVEPQDVWVVTDLGKMVKDGQRFFYSDGWQMMGKKDNGGFSLSIDNDPFVIVTTQESYQIIKTSISLNKNQDVKNRLQFFEEHAVIISETIFPQDQEKLQFDMPKDKEEEIRQKLKNSYPSVSLTDRKGYIVPSGELCDDQGGYEVMSYCWVENK